VCNCSKHQRLKSGI